MGKRKIMVGTDFSEASEVAAVHAANLARFLDAELILVHAGAPAEKSWHSLAVTGSAPKIDEMAKEQLARDRNQLEEQAERLRGGGLEVSARLLEGHPDEGLCQAASEENADLLVCGTHGRTGLQRFLLGSVAERVVRLSPGPVMVARNGDGDGDGGYRNVLVPTDFSELAERALGLALELAGEGARVELFHSWQLPGPAHGYEVDALVQGIREEIEARGSRLVEAHARSGVELSFRATRNTPAQGIQVRLEEEPFDLVVMGSHGRRGLSRFFLGSVAETTVRHASCSVAVVHGPKPS